MTRGLPRADRNARRLLETLFLAKQFAVNLGVAIVLTIAATALIFYGRSSVPLWGMGNLALDLIPSTLLPTVGATIAITKATASAIGEGLIKPTRKNILGLLPKKDWFAGLVIGLVLLAPLGLGFIGAARYTYDWQPVPYAAVMIFKLIYALILCLANTPLIVWRAKHRS
jgi:hypothetical protein